MVSERRSPRYRTHKIAHIVLDGGENLIKCSLRDLSDTGAALAIPGVRNIPTTFDLLFENEAMTRVIDGGLAAGEENDLARLRHRVEERRQPRREDSLAATSRQRRARKSRDRAFRGAANNQPGAAPMQVNIGVPTFAVTRKPRHLDDGRPNVLRRAGRAPQRAGAASSDLWAGIRAPNFRCGWDCRP
jgi:hypothetical protein